MKTISLTNSDLLIKVSDEDHLEMLLLGPWYLTGGYAITTKHPQESLHRLIAAKLGIQNPDHQDWDKLNNERDNLREATKSQNGVNREKYAGGTSIYKGVSWYQRIQKWRASIKVKGKAKHLGDFEDEKEAARAYNKAAITYFGEFAVINEGL